MIKVTYGDLLTAAPAFGVLISKEIPISTSARLRRIAVLADIELKVVNDALNELRKKHGAQVGQGYQVTPENMEVFQKEVAELLALEVEINVEPITAESLGDKDTVRTQVLLDLKKFVL